jgi:hypothetical protein
MTWGARERKTQEQEAGRLLGSSDDVPLTRERHSFTQQNRATHPGGCQDIKEEAAHG